MSGSALNSQESHQHLLQVPLVVVVLREDGRFAVSGSTALHQMGKHTWLTQFCQWLFKSGSEQDQIVIEDASQDER